jgi:hypothetical protein
MKTFVFTLLFVSQLASAQDIKLRLSNMAPRLHEKITVFLSVLTDIEGEELGKGEIELKNISSDTGLVNIGPFTIFINGVTYESDQLTVKIHPELPAERSGIWIRQVVFMKKEYLIIEQRLLGEWKSNKTSDKSEISSTFSAKEVEFGELDLDTFDSSEITFEFIFSTSYGQAVGKKDITGNENTHYQRSIFEIIKGGKFKSEVDLTQKNFKNLPPEFKFKKWTIR